MSSSAIKGITVEIGGNTMGLNKALGETNREINNTQSELKQVNRLLKLDPTNTELLKQKQTLLAQSISETDKKLKTLQEAEKQANKQFKGDEAGKESYRTLQREIVATKEKLESLKSQSNKTQLSLQKISSVSGSVSSATKGVSMAAGGAIIGIGAMAVKAGEAADNINTLSKQTGLSTDEIQKMQYASELVDVPLETITGSLAKMTKNMGSTSKETQKAWQTIGVSTTDASGHMRNTTDVFYDTLEALSKVKNGTERDQLAMQLFGKSANDLAGIVDDGGASLKKYGDEAKNSGKIMSKDALNGANDFKDGIDKMKASATADISKIGSSIAKDLLPLLQNIISAVSNVAGWFSNLSTPMKIIIGVVVGLVAVASPLAGVISAVSGTLALMKTATFGQVIAQTALNGSLLACPLTWIVIAIMAVIAAIVILYNNCSGFRDFINKAFEVVKQGFIFAINTIKTAFFAVVNAIKTAFEAVVNFFKTLFEVNMQVTMTVISAVKEGFIFAINTVKNGFTTAVNGIKTVFGTVVGFFTNVKDGIKNVFSGIGAWFSSIFNGAVDGIKTAFSSVTNFFKGIWDGISGGVKGAINFIIGGINTLISGANKLKFDIPSWVPAIGGKSFGINIPLIPKLAKGGILDGSALVGESGPEVLTTYGGRTQVTPLSGQNGTNALGANLSDVVGAIKTFNSNVTKMMAADKLININKREFGRLVNDVI